MNLNLINDNNYELISTHYKADSFTNGRAFKKFFDLFARKVFTTNLTILKDNKMQIFPIAYIEKNSYASIAHSLHSLTPFALSEWCVGYQSNETESSQNRFVDFWCMGEKKDFEAWIEIKRIWLNIAGNADKWNFTKRAKKKIQVALNQIENLIREVKIDKGRLAKTGNLKVVLLNIPISCSSKLIPDSKTIQSAPYKVADLLASGDYKVKWRKKGVLCAVLNLDTQGKKEGGLIYKGEYTPYFALGAVIFE